MATFSQGDVSAGGGGNPNCCFPGVVSRVNNANFDVPDTANRAVFLRALTADRTVLLPVAPIVGESLVVKDEDGSLALHNIVINGNGQTIDGNPTYTMTAAQNGVFGSVTLVFQGAGWSVI